MANTTGKKFGGRKKGTQNKMTASAKEAFQIAFDEIGGAKNLAAWAKENNTEFYKLFSRLIPTEAKVEQSGTMTIHNIEVEIVDPKD